MVVIERRIVTQEWYEPIEPEKDWEYTAWEFADGDFMDSSWVIVKYIDYDELSHPIMGIAERAITIDIMKYKDERSRLHEVLKGVSGFNVKELIFEEFKDNDNNSFNYTPEQLEAKSILIQKYGYEVQYRLL